MKEYKVAVLGATGAVGQQMMKVLEERNFPVKRLLPLASARSAGRQLSFRGEALTIEEATEASFAGMDIVLGAVSNEMAKRFAPAIQDSGAVFIDNSSAFRLREDVPLVVPEINPEDAFQHHGLVANPNCSTIQAMVALKPLDDKYKIKRIVYSTYQAVSGAGLGGWNDLENGLKGEKPTKFPHPIAGNCLPHIDVFLPNGVRCPFEVELFCHGDEKNIVSAAFANGDEGLVDVRGILPERGGDIGAGDDPLIGVGREYDLFLLEQAYRIGFLFCFFHLLLRKMRRRGGSAPV